MDRLPLTLNARDGLQLEQLILEADGLVLKQMMLLLRLRVDREDTQAAERVLAEYRGDAARLRAQRKQVDLSIVKTAQAAE